MNKDILKKYVFVYHVTSIPSVLYAGMANASEPYNFDDFIVPPELIAKPIEVRITLFDGNTGELIEMSSDMMPGSGAMVKYALNLTPLKMLEKLVLRLVNEGKRQNVVFQTS